MFREGDFGGATASTGDRIEDFALGDRISLSPVDANTGAAGNQAFLEATACSINEEK